MAAACAFAMTEAFLQRFCPASLQELTASSLSDKAPAIEPSPLGDFELLEYIWNFCQACGGESCNPSKEHLGRIVRKAA